MATAELKSYLEDRLLVLDPSIDLEAGSPAQTLFIEPVLKRLGTDPIDTDIETFLLDRFRQEFPDIYAGDPSVVADVFINPLIIFLEPFKREIETIKRNQSIQDPSVLSDDDADALVANFFEERTAGGFASGVGRIFFTNPINISIELGNRFFTASGLSFFPTSPVSITAEEMVFNKTGSLYFMDVSLRSEKSGVDYNIPVNELVGVDGIFGAVRVGNPRVFSDGATQIDTPTFVAQAREALTERSLVTRRGATARLNEVFQGEVRAVQIIGAQDEEMQRDILIAASPGHQWLTGTINLFDNVAFAQLRTIEGDLSDAPVPGDSLYIYLDPYSYSGAFSGLSQSLRLVRLTVEEVIFGPMPVSVTPFQVSYFVRWSGSFPIGVVVPNPAILQGGFSRKGVVRVSSLPDIGPVSLSVTSGDVHVYGHTDVYVRPILQPTSKAVLTGVADLGVLGNTIQAPTFVVERTTLTTTTTSNVIGDSLGFDFEASGVTTGDTLVIEEGDDAGSYTIGKTVTTVAYLTSKLTRTASGLRYRIQKKLRIDPFEPRIPKFPFGSALANDLATTIGSNLLTLTTNDLLQYGVAVGDVIRLKTSPDAGDFTITGFDSILGGQGILVDRPLAATTSAVIYEAFTPQDKVNRPLVRIKELLLLDSAKQSTGITIPPADPVAIVPTCDFTSAHVKGGSARSTGMVLPDMTSYVSSSINVAAPSGDRRYSSGFEDFTGVYRSMLFPNASYSEFNFAADAFGSSSYFLAIVENEITSTTNFPPIDPKPGESLTIESGPNKGSYLIKSIYKFRHFKADGITTLWTYFIKIYGSFPFDPLRQIITFLDKAETDGAVGAGVTKIANSGDITYPGFFVSTFNSLGTKMRTAFTFYGIGASPTAGEIQTVISALTQNPYEWGEPARGVLRSYFIEPTLFEQRTDENDPVTTYNFKTASGDNIQFRPEPTRYSKLELVPSRLSGDTDPTLLPRDSDFATPGTANFSDTTKPSLFVAEVKAGDTLSVHQELFFHGADKTRQTAVQTTAGSNKITAPTASGTPFTAEMVGHLVFIEEGNDKGGYRVTQFIDSKNLLLDKPMTVTTPQIIAQGSGSWGNAAGTMRFDDGAAFNFTPYLTYFLTLYGMDFTFEGSYKILTILGLGSVSLEGATFPLGFPQGTAIWVLTQAPATTPAPIRSGTELYGLRPLRMYKGVPTDKVISAVGTDPAVSTATIPTGIIDGYAQPYRVYRKNLRRITPTEMSEKVDDSLVFFDTEVVSLQPQPAANIPKDSYLTVDPATYYSAGYRFVVADRNLTYSMKESGFLDLPIKLLPVGSVDNPNNYLNVSGTPLQITYDQAEIVKSFQEFLDSAEERVTSANMLARHFLPTYASYDATFFDGSAPSVIAQDIFDYIDTLPIETPIDVSVVEGFIIQNGGNPETPTKVVVVIHDWDRKLWMERSENKLGGLETKVPYGGTPRVSYFVPGVDASGQDPLPAGERINLTRG